MDSSVKTSAVPICWDGRGCAHLGLCGERGSCQRRDGKEMLYTVQGTTLWHRTTVENGWARTRRKTDNGLNR